MFRNFAILTLLTLTATAARAETSASANVAYGDLNLSRPADARILADRLDTAARQVCLAANAGDAGFVPRRAVQDCIDDAIATAEARIEASFDRRLRLYLTSAHQNAEKP
jgi:UrcA family protein